MEPPRSIPYRSRGQTRWGRIRHPITGTRCPACGKEALAIEYRLTAAPLGSFSISGVSMKVPCHDVAWLVCDACGVEAEEKRE